MNKVKRVKDKGFTTISNVFLRDKGLSIKAKGFLAVVMGLPDDWEFSIQGICSILKEGKTAVYNVIDELKERGYCESNIVRNDKGLVCGNDYVFYEEPKKSLPDTDNPYPENPHADNQPQLNIDITNNLEDKKKTNINYTDIKKQWETVNSALPTIRDFGEKRKRALHNLLRNNSATVEDLYKVFQIISVCSFCNGNNSRKWVATLDWLINDTKGCFNRLLEGAYAFSDSEKQKVQSIVNGEQLTAQYTDEPVIINGQIYK